MARRAVFARRLSVAGPGARGASRRRARLSPKQHDNKNKQAEHRMNTKTATVQIALADDVLRFLKEAARKNHCSLKQATQHLIDFVPGSICDWKNAGYPMQK
jgi:hypothetical protein